MLSPHAQGSDSSAFVFGGMVGVGSGQVHVGEGLGSEEGGRMVLDGDGSTSISLLPNRPGIGSTEAYMSTMPLSPTHMAPPGNIPAVQTTITPVEEPMGTME